MCDDMEIIYIYGNDINWLSVIVYGDFFDDDMYGDDMFFQRVGITQWWILRHSMFDELHPDEKKTYHIHISLKHIYNSWY